jgi:hypothetical protein
MFTGISSAANEKEERRKVKMIKAAQRIRVFYTSTSAPPVHSAHQSRPRAGKDRSPGEYPS